MYADDTQLYISFSLTDEETLMQQLETCICDIDIWMVNRLKQNGEKTEVLYTYKARECEESWSDTGQLSDP